MAASIKSLQVPEGTPIPTTLQGFLDLLSNYLEVQGIRELGTIIVSETSPDADESTNLWLEVDNNRFPQSLKVWTGQSWEVLEFRIPTIPKEDRITMLPKEGDKVYDTTIEQELIYRNGSWRTSWGGKGQRIFVHAESSSEALSWYPGWVIDDDYTGKLIQGAGGDHLSGKDVGSDSVEIQRDNLPNEQISVKVPVGSHRVREHGYHPQLAGAQDDRVGDVSASVGALGLGIPLPIKPLARTLWVLRKL